MPIGVKHKATAADRVIGGQIRRYRQALNLTQAHLADAVGVTFQQMQKYETGTNRVSAVRLREIAEVLSVPVTFLFEEVHGSLPEAQGGVTGLNDFLATPLAADLVRAFPRIKSQDLRHMAIKLVRGLAESEEG